MAKRIANALRVAWDQETTVDPEGKAVWSDLDSHQYVLIGDQNSRLPFYGELASDWRQDSFRLWNVRGNKLYEVSPVTGAVVRTTTLAYSGAADAMRTLAFDVTSGIL